MNAVLGMGRWALPWGRPARSLATELRIDVALPPQALDADLERLHERLHTPGDSMHGLAMAHGPQPGLVLRTREADGEIYVYVEDVLRQRLAGYTVFNRLVELDRRADRCLRGPHSRYAAAYQRQGVATAVYEWALARGWCLISGPRQSPGAHRLWQRLARRHPLAFVRLQDKVLELLGPEVAPAVQEDFHTRMVLLGHGWSFERLQAETRCRVAPATR